MKIVIDIDDEQVLFDIKNRSIEAQTETDKVIIKALYNGKDANEYALRAAEIIQNHCKNINCSACIFENPETTICKLFQSLPTGWKLKEGEKE